ncbi:MAG: polysaccharide deacetylase family protein [Clostridiales bacterium]|nr:polysaccharide deacetylase family protein [Clostridiales bacterium]
MKIFILRRQVVTAVVCGVLAFGMVWLVSHPNAVGAAAVQRQLPVYSVQREEKVVALTFDAAWGNEDTQQLIDILGPYNVTATFFLVGNWVDNYPESVKALADAGHSIQNHSDTHPYMTQCSAEEILQELDACNNKIEAITGVRPTLIRPPYGDYNDTVINTIRSAGMEPIQWDVDSLDWKELSAAEITQRVLDGVGPGSIVLFHNVALHTPEALPDIITGLMAQGYSFVSVADLLLEGEYTIDHTGRQCPVEVSALSESLPPRLLRRLWAV